MSPQFQTDSLRNDKLLARLETSHTPIGTLVGACLGIVVPLAVVAFIVALISRWSRTGGLCLTAFFVIGTLSATMSLNLIRRRVKSGAVVASKLAVRKLVALQAFQVAAFATSALGLLIYQLR